MKFFQREDDQIEHYTAQRNAFLTLQSINAFTYVIEYWELEADEAIRNLWDKDCKKIEFRQAKYNSAMWFLNFIDNIASEEVL